MCCLLFQLVVAEVANKFAQSHFGRGVRDTNVRLLTKVVVQYIHRQVRWDNLLYYGFVAEVLHLTDTYYILD